MNHKAIYQHIADDATISGLVSTRIYHDAPPRNAAYPYIVYHNVTGNEVGEVEYASKRWQISIFGTVRPSNQSTAFKTLEEALISRFKGFRGTLGSGANTQRVKSIEFAGNSGELLLHDNKGKQVSLDFLFHYLRI